MSMTRKSKSCSRALESVFIFQSDFCHFSDADFSYDFFRFSALYISTHYIRLQYPIVTLTGSYFDFEFGFPLFAKFPEFPKLL